MDYLQEALVRLEHQARRYEALVAIPDGFDRRTGQSRVIPRATRDRDVARVEAARQACGIVRRLIRERHELEGD